MDEARPHPGRLNELRKLAVAYSNLNRLPSMRELFPGAASPNVSQHRAYNGVPPNIPALLLPSPPSAYERLQCFLADIYGASSDIFEQIDFAQSKEGQTPWSVNILGREYLCTLYYTDKKIGQEAAIRHAFEEGALSVLVRDRQPSPSHHAAALDLIAKFNDTASLSPLPAPVPVPSGSRTPMTGNIGHMSPFHPAMPYNAAMAGGQSPYHMAGAQSPYVAMAGAQSPYHLPPQSPYINGGFVYPIAQEEPKKRSRISSRRRSRSPKRRSRSKHRSRSKRRRTPESESESSSEDEKRSRRSSSKHRRKSRRRRRSRSDEVEDRGRKARKEDKKLSGEQAIVTGTGTEIAEGSALPPAESTPKDVNAELSPFLDYILDCLDAKTAEEDDAQLKRLSGKLDSGNREKLRLICQACDAVTEVQRVTAAADVGAG